MSLNNLLLNINGIANTSQSRSGRENKDNQIQTSNGVTASLLAPAQTAQLGTGAAGQGLVNPFKQQAQQDLAARNAGGMVPMTDTGTGAAGQGLVNPFKQQARQDLAGRNARNLGQAYAVADTGTGNNARQSTPSYYSRPEADPAEELRLENALSGSLDRVIKTGDQYTQSSQAGQNLGRSMQQLRGQLDGLYAQYSAEPSDAAFNQYCQVYAQFMQASQQASKTKTETRRQWSDYQQAVNQAEADRLELEQYRARQQEEYTAWRSTIRDPDTVSRDIQDLDGQIGQVQAQLAALNGYEARTLGSGNQVYTRLPDDPEARERLEGQLRDLQQQRELLQEEYDWGRYYGYEGLRENEDFALGSRYVPTGLSMTTNPLTGGYNLSGGDAEYEAVNQNGAVLDALGVNAIGTGLSLVGQDSRELKQLDPDQIQMYNYLYHTQGKAAASEYLDYVRGGSSVFSGLNTLQRQQEADWWAEYAREHPVQASAFSVLEGPLQGLSYVSQAADMLDGGDMDRDAGYNRLTNLNSAIRGEVGQMVEDKWGKVGSFTYQTGMSMADFLFDLAVSGGNEALSLAIMGTSAAASETQAALDRGLSDTQAFALGTIAGAAEVLTEKVSIETLLDKSGMGRRALGYWLQNFLAEGSEEVGSDLINWLADVLISQDESEWEQSIRSYQVLQGMDEEEAFWHAVGTQAASMGLDFLGGAISGGLMAIPGTISIGINNHQANRLNQAREQVSTSAQQTQGELPQSAPSGAASSLREGALGAEGLSNPENEGRGIQELLDQANEETAEHPENGLEQLENTTMDLELPADKETLQKFRRSNQITRALDEKNMTRASGLNYGVSEGNIQTAERLGQLFDRKVEFYSDNGSVLGDYPVDARLSGTEASANGFYDPDEDVIFINAASQHPVAQIIGHEVVHTLENTQHYRTLQSLVVGRLERQGRDVETMKRGIRELYSQNNATLSDDGTHELVAQQMEQWMSSEASIRELVQTDRTLAQRIRGALDRILAAFGSENARERVYVENLRDAFTKALNEAGQEGQYTTTENYLAQLRQQLGSGEISEEEYDRLYEQAGYRGGEETGRMYSISRTRNMDYEEQIDRYLGQNNQQLNRWDDIFVAKRDRGLSVLGLGAKPFFMQKSNLTKSMRSDTGGSRSAHGISETVIRNLPSYIQSPALVVIGDGRISVIADEWVTTEKGNAAPLLIGIDPNATVDGKGAYEIKSVYGREDFANWLSLRARDSQILAGDTNKAAALFRRAGLQLPGAVTYAADLTQAILAQSGERVNPSTAGENQNQRQYSISQDQEGLSRDNLAGKAFNAVTRAETTALNQIARSMQVSGTGQLRQVLRGLSNQYLQQGSLTDEAIDNAFEQAYGLASVTETDPELAEQERAWARNDFRAAVHEMESTLHQAARYQTARDAETGKTGAISQEEAKQGYARLKEARRTYEKAMARALLTQEDQMQVSRILKGEITADDLAPERYNVADIRRVAESKQPYEDLRQYLDRYKRQVRAQSQARADTMTQKANTWKDKKAGILYSRETMLRNVQDIIPDRAEAKRVNEAYFEPVQIHEADKTRMKNQYRDRVRKLNLSRTVKKGNLVSEAHAVQLLGEAQDNIAYLEQHPRTQDRDGKTIEEWRQVVQNLRAMNPNMDFGKIENAVKEFRSIYDELFEQMNEVRVRNGYEPVNYRQGYFPHFQPGDGDGLIAQFGAALGISTDVTALPTSINGLTHTFKPGITWFGNAQERLGWSTVYDAVEGFDKYIEGISDVIWHTDDIQNLRALSTQLRYRTGDEGLRERVDAVRANDQLTDDQKQVLIEDIYANGKYELSNFVVALDEYTNLLANKKSRNDRNMEQNLGRKWYNIIKGLESRVGANMVSWNVGSWLTNFIPLNQGGAEVGRLRLLKGMWDTLANIRGDKDGIRELSDFLTNRAGSDVLVQSWEQSSNAGALARGIRAASGRFSNAGGVPMELIDQFVAGSIVRARYAQNLAQGLSQAEAMHEADLWAANIMGDRSKGAMPNLFNQMNPLTKAITQFQLEVNNEFSHIFKDLPRNYKDKGILALTRALLSYFLGAYIFNEFYEAVVGRRAALDPIDALNDFAGSVSGYQLNGLLDTVGGLIQGEGFQPIQETERTGVWEGAKDLGTNLLSELPFTSGLSMLGIDVDGGRLPVSQAFPDLIAIGDAINNDSYASEKKWSIIRKELANPATYLVPPGGGGQLKKILQGVQAIQEGGSYTLDSEGNPQLQYPFYTDQGVDSVLAGAQSVVFGKTSTEEGQAWIEGGFGSMSAKYTAAYQAMSEAGVDQERAYTLLEDLRAAEAIKDPVTGETLYTQDTVRRAMLRNSDLPEEAMAAVYYGLYANDAEREILDLVAEEDVDCSGLTETMIDIRNSRRQTDGAGETTESEKDMQRAVLRNAVLSDPLKGVVYYALMASEKEQGLIGELVSSGAAGSWEAAQVLMDLAEAEKTQETSRSQVQRQILQDSGLDGEAMATVYTGMILGQDASQRTQLEHLTGAGMDRGEVTRLLLELDMAQASDDKTQTQVQREILLDSGLEGEALGALYYDRFASDKQKDQMDRLAGGQDDSGSLARVYLEQASCETNREKLAVLLDSSLSDETKGQLFYETFASDSEQETLDRLRGQGVGYSQAMDWLVQVRDTQATDDQTAKEINIDLLTQAGFSDEATATLYYDRLASPTERGLLNEVAAAGGDMTAAAESMMVHLDGSDLGQIQAVLDSGVNDSVALNILRDDISESLYRKLRVGIGYNISLRVYLDAMERRIDRDGNGSYTQAEIQETIEALGANTEMRLVLPGDPLYGTVYLSNDQKAALWQLLTGSTSAKNNPYSRSVGEAVLADIETLKAQGETTATAAWDFSKTGYWNDEGYFVLPSVVG